VIITNYGINYPERMISRRVVDFSFFVSMDTVLSKVDKDIMQRQVCTATEAVLKAKKDCLCLLN